MSTDDVDHFASKKFQINLCLHNKSICVRVCERPREMQLDGSTICCDANHKLNKDTYVFKDYQVEFLTKYLTHWTLMAR